MPHEASFQHPGDPATRAASEAPRVGRLRQRALSRPLFELPRRARAPRVLARRLPARRLPPPRCGPSARQWCSRATPLRWRRSSVLRKPRQPPPALPTTRSSNSPGISPIQRLARRWPSPAQPATSGLAPQPACIPSRLSPRLHGRYPALRSTAACAPVTPSSDRSIASVTLVEPGEDLVRLVDDDKVERRTGGKRFRSAFTPGELTADQIDPRGGEVRVILARLDAEQVQQLVCHCPIRDLGTMSRMRCAPSARLWAMTRPASMVLPSPTSSARMHPPSRRRRSAKMTASIWCGFGSIRRLEASRSAWRRPLPTLEAPRSIL